MRTLCIFLVVVPAVLCSLLQEGNKRRVATRTVHERRGLSGACADRVASWRTWDGGFAAEIVVRSADDAAASQWRADLELDRPVEYLESFDGDADVASGDAFTITSVSYNGKTEKGQERRFAIQGKVSKNSVSPQLKSLSVNGGEKVVCKEEKQVVMKSVGNQVAGDKLTMPQYTLGLYVLLADDSEEGFESESDSWDPQLFTWQQENSNVLFFTFIHPDTMEVPPSFKKLSDTRGTDAPGAVPADTVILFAIGGYAYSLKPNPWHWLTTREAAIAMAEKVGQWYVDYKMDGIDLDIEEGAGSRKEAGPYLIDFIKRLRELHPDIIISQPTYGYPQVQAEIDVINASWDEKGEPQGVADYVGLMVYEGTLALQYVKNYNKGTERWEGFPIKVNAPSERIFLGAKGSTSSRNIRALANAAVEQSLGGIMVWYASLKNGFDYAPFWDASTNEDSIQGYADAMEIFRRATDRSRNNAIE